MSDLSAIEKRKLERALGMGGGYVLNFSNRTFSEFFLDVLGIDIYSDAYDYGSGSKANRMRAFWDKASNHQVAKVLETIFENWDEFAGYGSPDEPPEACLRIVERLKTSSPVPDVEAIQPNAEDASFEAVARSVRQSIEQNEPETGLDRLHTFLVKYFRILCLKRGLEPTRDKPLHSLVGEYVKALKKEGRIESEVTERILKSTIGVLEAFNRVRNEHSMAHDNELLNYHESLLVFSYVASSIRFIETIENHVSESDSHSEQDWIDEIPF